MSRRRYLLSYISAYRWRPVSFRYLYHSLIPNVVGSAKLPSEYQEVEYIESSGTQKISTGFKANQDTRIVMDFQPDTSYNCSIIWGSDGGTTGRFNLYAIANALQYRVGYNDQLLISDTSGLAFTNQRSKLDWNKNVITLNGATCTLQAQTFDISDTQIELFYTSHWASMGSHSTYKLYSCQIYDNGALVRDFIPCYRKSDNVIGLYDLKNGVFYTNNGTGTFTKGNDVLYEKNVKDKADLFSIEGNGEIENQIFDYTTISTQTANGITLTNNNDGTFTLTGSKTLNSNSYFELMSGLPLSHYYLIYGANTCHANEGGSAGGYNLFCRFTGVSTAFAKQYGSTPLIIAPNSSTYPSWDIRIQVGNMAGQPVVFNDTFRVQIVDLTQRYGKGNEPTSVLDNRVVSMVNSNAKGKIEGTYKGSIISQIMASKKGRLPYGYQEIEYLCNRDTISASNRVWIDTGWKPNFAKKFKVEAVIMPNQPITSSYRLGILSSYVNDETQSALSLECSSANEFRFYQSGGIDRYTAGNSVVPYQKNTLIAICDGSNSSITANSSTTTFTNPLSSESVNTALIFIDQEKRGVFRSFNLYSMKIWEQDVLIRDFIPCVRIEDGVGGLFDLVNNVFYANSGTGTFLLGKPIYEYEPLPYEYQEVEYLESHGTEYIDTGYKPNQDTKLELGFCNVAGWLYGERTASNDTNQLVIYIDHSVYGSLRFGNSVGYADYDFNPIANQKNILVVNKEKYTLNNSYSRNFSQVSNFQSALSFIIFGCNINGSVDADASRVYYFKIYENNALVRNFIPCYRKADGVAGLYDVVSGTFYTNAGTGSFLVGREVIDNSRIVFPLPLQLNGAINSHDKFSESADKSSWVFTHDNIEIDLGTINYTYDSSHTRFYSTYELTYIKTPSDNDTLANILCPIYTTLTQNTLFNGSDNNSISFSSSGRLNIRNTTYTDATTFKTAMSGKYLHYQLATPQITRIPRKHLGIGHLADLITNQSVGANGSIQLTATSWGIKTNTSYVNVFNFYCERFITATYSQTYNAQVKSSIAFVNNVICIQDDSFIGKTITQVKDMLQGVYVYYPTENEVDDIDFTMGVEVGGTITANMFSWVENQYLPIPTIQSQTINGIVITNNNDGSITLNGTASADTTIEPFGNLYNQDIKQGDVYFLRSFENSNHATYYVYDAYDSNLTWNNYDSPNGYVKTKSSSSTTISPRIVVKSGVQINKTISIVYVNLTKGFPNGDIPNNINDPRIQKIIELGYIPKNTTGTYKEIDCEVLPNVEVKVKCK